MTVKTRVKFNPSKGKYNVYVRRGWAIFKWWEIVEYSKGSYDSGPKTFGTFEEARTYAASCATDIVFQHRAEDYVV